jgi:plasmid maintenance system antidote protein VapI
MKGIWCKFTGTPFVGNGLRIEKAFGVSMDTLMRMQNSYNIAQARKREGEIK